MKQIVYNKFGDRLQESGFYGVRELSLMLNKGCYIKMEMGGYNGMEYRHRCKG